MPNMFKCMRRHTLDDRANGCQKTCAKHRTFSYSIKRRRQQHRLSIAPSHGRNGNSRIFQGFDKSASKHHSCTFSDWTRCKAVCRFQRDNSSSVCQTRRIKRWSFNDERHSDADKNDHQRGESNWQNIFGGGWGSSACQNATATATKIYQRVCKNKLLAQQRMG